LFIGICPAPQPASYVDMPCSIASVVPVDAGSMDRMEIGKQAGRKDLLKVLPSYCFLNSFPNLALSYAHILKSFDFFIKNP
jgi:hypothetical protein